MNINNPHDKFFKETFGNVTVAGDFLTNYLPASIVKYIDIDTLDPQKDSFIDNNLDENFSDLLFKANIANEEGYVYFLFEHKSYPDKGVAFQVLRYMIEIWEAKMDKEMGGLPVVLPLVVFHGNSSWRISSSLGDILNGYNELPEDLKIYVPNFEYLLYDITDYSDEEIKGVAQTRIGLTLLRDIFTSDNEKFLQSFHRSVSYLNELEDRQTGIEYFETMIRYIASAARNLTKKDVQKILQDVERNYQEGSEIAMTLADMWREEGREEGRKEGREEERKTVQVEIVEQGLIERFKKIPDDIREGIQTLDAIALQSIILKLMSKDGIKNLDEVRTYF